jgi:hypothetical protein
LKVSDASRVRETVLEVVLAPRRLCKMNLFQLRAQLCHKLFTKFCLHERHPVVPRVGILGVVKLHLHTTHVGHAVLEALQLGGQDLLAPLENVGGQAIQDVPENVQWGGAAGVSLEHPLRQAGIVCGSIHDNASVLRRVGFTIGIIVAQVRLR